MQEYIDYYLQKIKHLPIQTVANEFQWKLIHKQRQITFKHWVRISPPLISVKHGRRLLGKAGYSHLPPFFISSKDNKDYQNTFAKHFSSEQLITKADKICNNQFHILGRGADLSSGIDWHKDIFSGHRWNNKKQYFPVEHVIPEIQVGKGADIKVPWELSRLQFVLVLGQAYWLTKDEKYAQKFVQLMIDWLGHNPPYRGINWCSPMEVAIRAANLIWGIYFFTYSDMPEDELAFKLISLLEWHGHFIYANVEKWFEHTGNHYLANLTGLIYLGVFLSKKKWLNFAKHELIKEMENQVFEDGVHFEASIPYHRLALECFFYSAQLCSLNQISLPESFWLRLKKMFAYTEAYLKPNGTAPQLGDNDSGQIHDFGFRSSNDHTYLPAIAKLAFKNEMNIPFPEALLIFGPQSVDNVQKTVSTPAKSQEFSEGGIYIMRNHEAFMLISCGPNGFYKKGAHAHNDKLSFELNYRQEEFIIDSGSYLYTSDPESRNLFRSTAYHNTIKVDNQEQNRFDPDNLFCLHLDSCPQVLNWESNSEEDIFYGQNDGYVRLKQELIHEREIVFNKRTTHWKITDILEGKGEHFVEWFLHLAPGVRTEILAGEHTITSLTNNGKKLTLHTQKLPQIINTFYSPEYGAKVENNTLYWSAHVTLPYTETFEILGVETGS